MDSGEVELLAGSMATKHIPTFEAGPFTDVVFDDEKPPSSSSAPSVSSEQDFMDDDKRNARAGEGSLKACASSSPTPGTDISPSRTVITILACIAFLLLGGLGGIIGPSVPSLASKLGLLETKLAGVFTSRGLGFLVGSFSMPYLDKYLPKYLLMTLCTTIAGIVTFSVVFAPTISPLLALMFLQGLSLAGVVVTGNAVLVEVWGKAVDPYMQGLHAAFGVGAVLGPVAVGGIGYRDAFLIFSTVAVLPVAGVTLEEIVWGGKERRRRRRQQKKMDKIARDTEEEGQEEDLQRLEEGQEDEARVQVEERRAIILCGENPVEDAASTSSEESGPEESLETEAPPPQGEAIGNLYRGLLSCFLFLYTGSEVGVGGWIATVLLLQGAVKDKEAAAFVVATFWGALTAGRFLAVPLALKLKPSRFLFLQLGITLGSALLFLGVDGGRGGGRGEGGHASLLGMTLASALYGLGMSSIFPLMMTLPGEMNLHLDMKSTSLFVIGAWPSLPLFLPPSLPPSVSIHAPPPFLSPSLPPSVSIHAPPPSSTLSPHQVPVWARPWSP
jgi:MFS family permease